MARFAPAAPASSLSTSANIEVAACTAIRIRSDRIGRGTASICSIMSAATRFSDRIAGALGPEQRRLGAVHLDQEAAVPARLLAEHGLAQGPHEHVAEGPQVGGAAPGLERPEHLGPAGVDGRHAHVEDGLDQPGT